MIIKVQLLDYRGEPLTDPAMDPMWLALWREGDETPRRVRFEDVDKELAVDNMHDRWHYLIWSNEHRGWWGPGRSGYVGRVEDAGRYSPIEALQICTDAIPGTSKRLGMLPELPVRVEDAAEMLSRFAGLYPGHDPEPER